MFTWESCHKLCTTHAPLPEPLHKATEALLALGFLMGYMTVSKIMPDLSFDLMDQSCHGHANVVSLLEHLLLVEIFMLEKDP